ncbi:hypothetical protein IHE45_14G004200 [Dioscorea alata]|uniref:Uncharacterized protein n=1 Tax=Dioscorea alata TaxID=55571 RepID=A0ACB7UPT9_DIOAL|nr:hypothetical protein IHE45_14G004200 [Dioscorea alata]
MRKSLPLNPHLILSWPSPPSLTYNSTSSNTNYHSTHSTNVFFTTMMQCRYYRNTNNYYRPKNPSHETLNKILFAFAVQSITILLGLSFTSSSSSSSSSSASYSTKVLTMSTIVLFCFSLISTAMVLPLKFQRLAQAISYLSAILAFISMSTILLNSRDYYWLFLFLFGTFLLLFWCIILCKKLLPPVFPFKNLFSIRFAGNQPLQNHQMRLRITEEDGDDAVV